MIHSKTKHFWHKMFYGSLADFNHGLLVLLCYKLLRCRDLEGASGYRFNDP